MMEQTNQMKWIKELKENERILGRYLVTNVVNGVTNNGLNYMTITFQDCTASIEGKKWEVFEEDRATFVAGNIVEIEADVINYRSGLQLKVLRGTIVPESEMDISLFVKSAPVPREELERKLMKYIDSIEDEDLHRLVSSIILDDKVYARFIQHPAAVRNHHEYASGLLYHTITMADFAELVSHFYNEEIQCNPPVDRDLLLSGVLLHDVGKIVELSGPIIAKYTKEGRLIGHISIMHSVIREKARALGIDNEKRILLEHMILAHHGKQEFGSPVVPLTREALLLHMIDDMNAKMTIIDKALEPIEEGEFTPKIYPLEERCFYKPIRKKK